MLVLRIAAPLEIPVLDGADDMAFVRRAKLDLDFIARCALRIGEQQVEPTGSWLTALNVPDRQIAEAQEGRVSLKNPLEPTFAEFRWSP